MTNKTMDYDSVEVEDSEGYHSGADKGSFKQLCLEQYRRCCIEGCKEMTAGGVVRRETDEGIVELFVENQQEIFINSVAQLRNLLWPQILKRKKYLTRIEQFEQKINKMTKALDAKLAKLYSKLDGMSHVRPPDGGYSGFDKLSQYLIKYRRYAKAKLKARTLMLYRDELFRTLIELLAELNYLDETGGSYV